MTPLLNGMGTTGGKLSRGDGELLSGVAEGKGCAISS